MRRHPSILLLPFVLIGLLPAQTTTVFDAAADATLHEHTLGQLANGSGVNFFAGNSGANLKARGLVRFDLGATIPPGATILSAKLVVYVDRLSTGAQPFLMVHRVTRDWTEGPTVPLSFGGGGGGGFSVAGDVTWLHTNYPNDLWSVPGGDFDSRSAGNVLVNATGTQELTGLAADVQAFVDGALPNHGWMLKTDELAASQALRIVSRESLVVPLRPRLEVTWTLSARRDLGFGCGPLTLGAASAPITGQPYTLDIAGGQALEPVFLFPAAFAAPGALPLPGSAGCALDLDPISARLLFDAGIGPWIIPQLDASGEGAVTLTIPPGIAPLDVVLQGIGTAGAWRTTNVLQLQIRE